jgi:hypothetical protein
MAYLNSVAGGTSVSSGAAVPLTALTNTPAGTQISLPTPANGQVIITDSGYYQISFAIEVTVGASNPVKFALSINGVTTTFSTFSNQQPNTEQKLQGMTGIYQITNPTTLTIVNLSGGARTLRNASNDATSVMAYMTIMKLQ